MTVEERLDQLEKRNKRLTVALTMMAVVVCAVVTMAATGLKDGHFDTVTARHIWVTNDAGDIAVSLTTSGLGDGQVTTQSAEGKILVSLSSTVDSNGQVGAWNRKGEGRTLQPGP